MSKKDRESRLRAGEKQLVELGLDTTGGAAALVAQIGRGADTDLAIAARLARSDDASAIEALQRLEAQSADKLVAKEAKRSLFLLQQRGAVVPEVPKPAAFSLSVPVETTAMVSAVDGRGDQLVWLERPARDGVDVVFAVLSHDEGAREVQAVHGSRKDLRGARQEMFDKNQIGMAPIDWRYADSLVTELVAQTRARGGSIEDYARMRQIFTDEPPMPVTNPALEKYPEATVMADESALAGSAALLGTREMRTWFLTMDDVAPYIEEFQRIRDSPLVLDRSQQQERLNELVQRAVVEIYGGANRDKWVRRLQAIAAYFDAAAQPGAARASMAVSYALAKSEHGGRGIPFCEFIVRTGLRVVFERTEMADQESAQSSLVLSPGQALRENAPRKP